MVVAVVLVGAACGSLGTASNDELTAATPGTTATAPDETVVDITQPERDQPEELAVPDPRIIPVDGDLAEVVFALGLGDLVVATDISATFPAQADALPEIGYQRSLSAEPIAAFEPSIVLATDIAGPLQTLDDLERLGIEVVVIPSESSRFGPGDKIRAVADALGVAERGAELADQVDVDITTAIERVEQVENSLKVGALYVRGKNVQLLLGEGGGVDWMIDAAGGVDIADQLGIIDHAPINAESLVVAAPDVLLIPARGLESVGGIDGLIELPGIAETPAARNGRILAYDDQYLLGNGPRVADFLNQLITDLHGDI